MLAHEAKALATPRNLSVLATVLIAWTLVISAVLFASGLISTTATSLAPLHHRAPLAFEMPQRMPDGEEVELLERQWTEKLLHDLQASAADESVSATLEELRSTLTAREHRQSAMQASNVGASKRKAEALGRDVGTEGGAVAAATAQVEVPRYNAQNIDELRKAALFVVDPRAAKEPMPQLLRDMSDALARQKEEQDKLLLRLAKLEPQVTNYNPADTEQLAKAVEQVVAEHGGASSVERGGPLPRLLAHLKSALGKKMAEQAALDRRVQRAERKRERTFGRAKLLQEIILRQSSPVNHATMMIGELVDEVEQALDDSAAGCLDGKAPTAETSEFSPPPPWKELVFKVRQFMLDEFDKASERNASMTAEIKSLKEQLASEQQRHSEEAAGAQTAVDQQQHATGSEMPNAVPSYSENSADEPTTHHSGEEVLQADSTSSLSSSTTSVPETDERRRSIWPYRSRLNRAFNLSSLMSRSWVDRTSAEVGVERPVRDGPPIDAQISQSTDEGAASLERGRVSIPQSSTQDTTASGSDSTSLTNGVSSQPLTYTLHRQEASSPPPLNSGACEGKRCPEGYVMVDRGDQCICRT